MDSVMMEKLLPWKNRKHRSAHYAQPKQQKMDSNLKRGLELGSEKQVRKYFGKHPSHIDNEYTWNQYPAEKVPALHIAASGRRVDVVSTLLQNKANVNMLTESKKNALHFAAQSPGCDCAIVDELVNRGININGTDVDGKTPLMMAVENNNVGVVRRLVENFADQAIADSFGQIPLQIATQKQYTPIKGILNKSENFDKDQKIKQMETKLEEMDKNYKSDNQQLRTALSQSQDTIHQLVSVFGPCINQPGFRNSIAGYTDSAKCSSVSSLHDNESERSQPRTRCSWASPNSPISNQHHEFQDITGTHNSLHSYQDERLRQEHHLDSEDGNMPIGIQAKVNIQSNYGTFLSNMKPYEVIIGLYEKHIINTDMKQKIQSISGTQKKNDTILTEVIICGTKADLLVFLQILDNNCQTHLANIIRGSHGRVLYSSYPNTGMKQQQYLRNFTQSEPDFLHNKGQAGTNV